MKKIYYTLIIFLIILIFPDISEAYSIPTGEHDPAWDTAEVRVDELGDILSGVNDLAQQASTGDEEAAQELRYKMAMLNLFWEKYLFFGDYVRNIPEALESLHSPWSADPWEHGQSLYVKSINMPDGKVLRHYYRYLDNEYATKYVIPVFTRNGRVSEAREVINGVYAPSYCCERWSLRTRPFIQTGEEPTLINGSITGDRLENASENITAYYSVEDILADGYYSGIFTYAGNYSHAFYVEAIVYNGTEGYIYASNMGSGLGAGTFGAHYEGVTKYDISYLLNAKSSLGGKIFVVTGGELFEATNTEADDSDLGGVVFDQIFNFLATIIDAIQSVISRCITGEWRWVLVGENVESNLNGTEAFAGEFKNLNIWAAEESSNIEGWPVSIEAEEIGGSYGSGSDNIREEDGDDGATSLANNGYFINATGYTENYKYPQIVLSPEEIFSGSIDLLNANFFRTDVEDSAWNTLKNAIIYWFRVFRYIGLALMLSALIYIGIKIMITSVAEEKGRYKNSLTGWFIGIIMIFFLPYIMSFIFTLSDSLVNLMKTEENNMITVYVYDAYTEDSQSHSNKLEYTKFTTNLTGLVRFQIQSRNLIKKISYLILYLMIAVYTFKFTVMYLKRMLYIAFLILISPLVAVMYPIDRVRESNSQTFSAWLKEFVFNVLLQPVHMLLYFILVTSAMSFATDNIIYVIVAFAFISNAEKILKKIFGFDQASMGTVGGVAESAQKAMTFNNIMHTVRNVKHIIDKNKKPKENNNNSNNNNNQNREITSGEESRIDYTRDFNSYNENQEADTQDNQHPSEEEQEESGNQDSDAEMEEQERQEQEEKREEHNEERTKEEENQKGEEESKVSKFFKDKKGNLKALVKMARRRKQVFTERVKHNLRKRFKGLNAKKVIIGTAKATGKVVGKVGKVVLSTGVGTAAVLGQAAYSVASDGKYSLAEGIGTFAAATAGTNSLLNTAGQKMSNLSSEYRETRDGEEAEKERMRVEDFWKGGDTIRQYQSLYGEMGKDKLSYEIERGERLAKGGVEGFEDQTKVATFIDSLADERFNSRFSASKFKTDEERQKAIKAEADRIRATGSKKMRGLTDEDVIKSDIIKKGNYEQLGIKTYQAEKQIPKSVVRGKDTKSWIESQTAGNEQEKQGMEKAIKMINKMNLAQSQAKNRMTNQRSAYEKIKKGKKRSK